MQVLVAYATRHGATKGIAEHIASGIERPGVDVRVAEIRDVGAIDAYDAFVIGSAAYMGRWLGEASRFVRAHASELSARPVWLFSSGPIGPDRVDRRGRDVLATSAPREFEELGPVVHARDTRVFFGALDPDAKPIGLVEQLSAPFVRRTALRDSIGGDYRDWPAIEAWADSIGRQLVHAPAAFATPAS